MFAKKIPLFRVLGFDVSVDPSWTFLVVLVTWSLATGYFPRACEGLPAGEYWLMGLVGAFGLFASIVVHELCHSVVARRFGVPMRGITLFLFGGIAEMERDPPSAKAEFWIAIVGPIASFVVAALAYGAATLSSLAGIPLAAVVVLTYLAWINAALATFNLVPAFPLDGGRILRAALWAWRRDLRGATRTSARVGVAFGTLLLGLGVIFALLGGGLLAGLWWFVIGLFVRNAAASSYQQLLLRQSLEGRCVADLMNSHPASVSPSTTIESLVRDGFYRLRRKMLPVVEGEALIGTVSTRDIRQVPSEAWPTTFVGEVLSERTGRSTVSPSADAFRVLLGMQRDRLERLHVVESGRLVGEISLDDLLAAYTIESELASALPPLDLHSFDRFVDEGRQGSTEHSRPLGPRQWRHSPPGQLNAEERKCHDTSSL